MAEGVMGMDLNELLKLTGAVLSVGGFWAAITIVSVRAILNRAIAGIEERIEIASESIMDHRRRLDSHEARIHDLDITVLKASQGIRDEVTRRFVTAEELADLRQWMQEIRAELHALRDMIYAHERDHHRHSHPSSE